MKVARGFQAKLAKEDNAIVDELMKAHPTWPKTYARRIAAQKKFYRMMAEAGSKENKNE